MKNAFTDELTFDGLLQFLQRTGFAMVAKVGNSLALQHTPSNALLVLSIPRDGRTVRPADLITVQSRLESHQLANVATLSQLKFRKLPLAS